MRRLSRALVLLAVLPAVVLPASGCFSYQTVPMDELTPDLDVRVRITQAQVPRVAEVLGYETRDVEGKVATVQPDVLLLTVPARTAPEGGTVRRFYQRLDLPMADVVEVEHRSLNRGKTIAVVGGATIAATAILLYQFIGINRKDQKGTKSGPENVRVPLFGIGIR